MPHWLGVALEYGAIAVVAVVILLFVGGAALVFGFMTWSDER